MARAGKIVLHGVSMNENNEKNDSGWDKNKHHIKVLKILTEKRYIKFEVIGILIVVAICFAYVFFIN
jgi:hypothetical protein